MSSSRWRKGSLSFAGLLIEEWEKVQLKTFVKWANSQLETCCSERFILRPTEDLQDGIALICLLQSLTGQNLGKYHASPKMDLHKAENINKALGVVNAFCEEKKLRLQYTAEDILSGNVKMIMGLLWVLISKFAIDIINEGSLNAREGLLHWCQRKLATYESVKVENFSRSFSDGLAFCALIHKHRPDLIDFDSLDPAASESNLRLAFTTAQKEMGIPMLLDPDDFIRSSLTPDEKSVMTYLSLFWRHFANSKSSHVASKRIKRLLVSERENRELASSYEQAATDLAKWIDEQTKHFLGHRFGRTEEDLTDARKRLESYFLYAKCTKLAQRNDIENSLRYLQTKLKQQKRAPYTPPSHCGPERLQAYWTDLCAAEMEYERAIQEAATRMQKASSLMKEILSQAKSIDGWRIATQNEALALNRESINKDSNASDVEAVLTKNRVLSAAGSSQNNRLCSLERRLKEIHNSSEIEPSCSTEILRFMNEIRAELNEFRAQLDTQENSLNTMILDLRAREMRRQEIAQRADDLALWCLETKIKLESPITCLDKSELADKRERLQMDGEDIRLKEDNITELENLIAAPNTDHENRYSRVSVERLRADMEALRDLALNRQSDLDAEEQRLNVQTDLVEQYYSAICSYSDLNGDLHVRWREKLAQERDSGDCQQLVQFSKDFLHELREKREQREADVVRVIAQLNANNTTASCVHTVVCDKGSQLPQLSSIKMDLQNLEQTLLNSIESENEDVEESPALPETQIEELREVFNEFDPEGEGFISKASLQKVLQINDLDISAGEIMPYLESSDIQNSTGLKGSDHKTRISWDNFLLLMERKLHDGDAYEEVLEAFTQVSGNHDGRTVTESQLRGAIEDENDVGLLLAEMDVTRPPGQETTYDFVSFVDICYGRTTRREIEEERARALAEEESRRRARQEAERQAQEEAERRAREYREMQRKRREQELEERRQREEEARRQAREAEAAALAAAKAAEEARQKAEAEEDRRRQEAKLKAEEEEREKKRAEEEQRQKELDAAREQAARERAEREREEKKETGKSGYLWKKGGSKSAGKGLAQRRNWNQRYFKIAADGVLRYFADKTDAGRLSPKGEIDIKTVRSIRVTRYRERPFCITFDIDGSQGREEFLIDAGTKEEADAWIDQLGLYSPDSP